MILFSQDKFYSYIWNDDNNIPTCSLQPLTEYAQLIVRSWKQIPMQCGWQKHFDIMILSH